MVFLRALKKLLSTKVIASSIVCICFTLSGFSQLKYFNKAVLNDTGVEGFGPVVVSDSTFTILGFSRDSLHDFKRIIYETDCFGDTLWTRTYYADTALRFTGGFESSLTKHGSDYFVCGRDYLPNGEMNPILQRINGTGDTLWTSKYDSTQSGTFLAMAFEPEKNRITCAGAITGSSGSLDISIVQYDTLGSVQWDAVYGLPMQDEHAYSIIPSSDGGYYAGGFWGVGPSDAFLIKLDSLGNQKWLKLYGLNGSTVGIVSNATDTSILLHGQTENQSSIGIGFESFVYLLDSSGNMIWDHYYQVESNGIANWNQVCKVVHDGIVVAGSSYMPSKNLTIGVLKKLNWNGDLKWVRHFKVRDRNSQHYFEDLDVMSDSGFIVSGYAGSYNGFTQDGWLVRTNCIGYDTVPRADFQAYNLGANLAEFYNTSHYAEQYHWDFGDGNTYTHWSDPADTLSSEPFVQHQYTAPGSYIVTLHAIACDDTTTTTRVLNVNPSHVQDHPHHLFTVFPNPTSGQFNVTIDESMITPSTTLEIYTVDGRLIKTIPVASGNGKVEADINEMQPGIYFVSLIVDGIEKRQTKRLVKL